MSRYGKVEALHGVSLDVDAGPIVTVIGPNGAGKSTLLAALMGLLPAAGTVRYDGQRRRRRCRWRSAWHAGLALVPERRELFGEHGGARTTCGSARFQRSAAGRQRRRGRPRRGLSRCSRGCTSAAAQLAGTLSGGERQMLALGRALMAQAASC